MICQRCGAVVKAKRPRRPSAERRQMASDGRLMRYIRDNPSPPVERWQAPEGWWGSGDAAMLDQEDKT